MSGYECFELIPRQRERDAELDHVTHRATLSWIGNKFLSFRPQVSCFNQQTLEIIVFKGEVFFIILP